MRNFGIDFSYMVFGLMGTVIAVIGGGCFIGFWPADASWGMLLLMKVFYLLLAYFGLGILFRTLIAFGLVKERGWMIWPKLNRR